MHRFFVSPDAIAGQYVHLSDEQAHQILRVLRLAKGDQIIILDNTGCEYEVVLEEIQQDEARGVIIRKNENKNEPLTHLTLLVSLLKRENFELVLQKCTELGIKQFIPLLCDHTVLNRVEWHSKNTRWRRIIQEAAEQSGRGFLPILHPPQPFKEAILNRTQFDIVLIAHEKEKNISLNEILKIKPSLSQPSIGLFIGPEGGFSEIEIALASAQHIPTFTLGKRILRAETAAIVASGLVLNYFRELG